MGIPPFKCGAVVEKSTVVLPRHANGADLCRQKRLIARRTHVTLAPWCGDYHTHAYEERIKNYMLDQKRNVLTRNESD